jgi:hypothetical protein
MSLLDEFRGSVGRFKERIAELQALLRAYSVDGIRPLVRLYREDTKFKQRWDEIWAAAARDDGGKLSFAAVGAILGATLGGAGIAAMGTAFGLPLLAVLGLGGLVAGTEVDAAVRREWGDTRALDLPRDIHDRVVAKASELGVEPRQLVAEILRSALMKRQG